MMMNNKGYPAVRTENLITFTDIHSPISALTREDGSRTAVRSRASVDTHESTETRYFSLALVGKAAKAILRRFSRKKKSAPTPPPKLRIGRTSSFAELNSPVLSHGQRSGNLSEHGVGDALLVCHVPL